MIPQEYIIDFTDSFKATYSFDQLEYDQNPRWKILHDLYMRNVVMGPYMEDSDKLKIPKKIHQIWLGSTLPTRYNQWCESWRMFNPDWEYKLWTDADLKKENIHITDWKLFNSITNMGQKSDYLRYHVLNQFGGLYVDTDFECLKSFEDLLYLDFFAGISYDATPIVNIAILGSIPNHLILQKVIKTMDVKPGDTSKEVFRTTGPVFFTEKFFETINSYMRGVVALPPDYLYPFPNNFGFQNRNGKDYIKPYSYAIHYWDVSWIKSKGKK
jgi:mannosyltransferase OCH1-like enzyme